MKWEYVLIAVTLNQELAQVQESMNELGSQGWELVSMVAEGEGEFTYDFKRPKQ
jgi:hypothetical protein